MFLTDLRVFLWSLSLSHTLSRARREDFAAEFAFDSIERSMMTLTTTVPGQRTAGVAAGRRVRGTSGGIGRRAFSMRPNSSSANASDETTTTTSSASSATQPSTASALTWEYETIAGRCAMAGYAIGASREVTEGATMLEQLGRDHLIGTMIICAAIGWASVAPFAFNPQEYEANPKGLMEKKGMSGFAAMEELNLNAMVEETHGRLAMCGFIGTALVELVIRAPVFGH